MGQKIDPGPMDLHEFRCHCETQLPRGRSRRLRNLCGNLCATKLFSLVRSTWPVGFLYGNPIWELLFAEGRESSSLLAAGLRLSSPGACRGPGGLSRAAPGAWRGPGGLLRAWRLVASLVSWGLSRAWWLVAGRPWGLAWAWRLVAGAWRLVAGAWQLVVRLVGDSASWQRMFKVQLTIENEALQ